MRKRNCSVILRLTEDEMKRLDDRVKRSGVTRQTYLRHLINRYVPRAAPPAVYHDMMRELNRIGNNLNQIAAKAHRIDAINVQQYDENVRALNRAIETIVAAVVNPQPMSEADAQIEAEHSSADECKDPAGSSSDLFDELFGGSDSYERFDSPEPDAVDTVNDDDVYVGEDDGDF